MYRRKIADVLQEITYDIIHIYMYRRKIADVLQEIQQYQNTPYCLTMEPSIQVYITSYEAIMGHRPYMRYSFPGFP